MWTHCHKMLSERDKRKRHLLGPEGAVGALRQLAGDRLVLLELDDLLVSNYIRWRQVSRIQWRLKFTN